MVNEGFRYINIRLEDQEKTRKYDEFSSNYKILMKNYQNAISYKDILPGLFGINWNSSDLHRKVLEILKKVNSEKLNEEYIISKIA